MGALALQGTGRSSLSTNQISDNYLLRRARTAGKMAGRRRGKNTLSINRRVRAGRFFARLSGTDACFGCAVIGCRCGLAEHILCGAHRTKLSTRESKVLPLFLTALLSPYHHSNITIQTSPSAIAISTHATAYHPPLRRFSRFSTASPRETTHKWLILVQPGSLHNNDSLRWLLL